MIDFYHAKFINHQYIFLATRYTNIKGKFEAEQNCLIIDYLLIERENGLWYKISN